MSKLNIDQKTVLELFSNKNADYLIPDYQRPYAWQEDQLETLWDDIVAFAIPQNDASKFHQDEDYFLGPVVTFRNAQGQLEIIDGQQRLTTLMLLLRAFYAKFLQMKDEESLSTKKSIEKCIWKTDEFDRPNPDHLKIDSAVASDDDKDEFLAILRDGKVLPEQKSKYANAFRFFQTKINDFVSVMPTYTPLLAMRLLKNVILLPIEAESQNTALRIFATLNDRGLPLADADIFKSQLYKYFAEIGKKDEFVARWKVLEQLAEKIFAGSRSLPMDELFTRYMYYKRAQLGIRATTTQGLRDFYERNSYELLRSEETLTDLELLGQFWEAIDNQEDSSDRILRRLFVLEYAPNRMWTYLVSVYFMHNHDGNGKLKEEPFYEFLTKITGFIWAYAFLRPGVNALRTPIYPEMVKIVNDKPVTFENYLFKVDEIREAMSAYVFTNGRPLTKSMLVWWAMENPQQILWNVDTKLEIEHIYSRARVGRDPSNPLTSDRILEALGNKAMLEKSVNIRASDYRFADKKNFYLGRVQRRGRSAEATWNVELKEIATSYEDFVELDIHERNDRILTKFIEFLNENDLLT